MEEPWQEEIEKALEDLDLCPRWCSGNEEGWSIRCPNPDHNGKGFDKNRSAFCFASNGYIHCYAGCEGTNINKLTHKQIVPYEALRGSGRAERQERREKLALGEFTALWLDLDPIPHDMNIKGVPAVELNKRGWRMYDGGIHKPGIFIPYFDTTREHVVFYQIRHLEGDQRFTFPTGARQVAYGLEQLPKCEKFLCFTEGSRDSVILGMAGVPAVALPSSNSKDILAGLLDYAKQNSLTPVAICDRDEAGEKLLQSCTRLVLDARSPYGKDVGDFLEQRGLEEIKNYYATFIPQQKAEV